jgi:cell wall-associated NlpC family hydrolase
MSDTEKPSQPISGTQKPDNSTTTIVQLDDHQKQTIREALVAEGRKLLGIKYEFGAEWTDFSKTPEALDCSELVEGVYHLNGLKMPDGSQSQYDFCIHSPSPRPGDLAFFGRGGNAGQIYHVGMVFDEHDILEARAFDPTASFKTGCVILRDLAKWTGYKNFVEFKSHPKLI